MPAPWRFHGRTLENMKRVVTLGRGASGKSTLARFSLAWRKYGNGLVALKLGPFLDIGKIADSSTAARFA